MSLNSKRFAQFYSGPHLYHSYLMQPLQFLCVCKRSRSAARSRLLVCRSAPVARGSSAALAGRPPLISRSSARGSRPGPLIRRSPLTPLARAARPPLVAPTRAARPRLAPWTICCSTPLSGFATPFLAPRFPELDSVGTWFLAARMEKPQKGFVDT